jgi:type IV pilus assembly protein PilW
MTTMLRHGSGTVRMSQKFRGFVSLRQNGFTLIELMVALVLSMLVVLASAAALLMSRQGFVSADAASQLRDNSRFAADAIRRLVKQSGYKDVAFLESPVDIQFNTGASSDSPAPIFGFNNALLPKDTQSIDTAKNNSRDSDCPFTDGTACANGSDILVVRYQAGSLRTSSAAGGDEVDKVMFNCAGALQAVTPISSSDVIESALGVEVINGEPSLICKYKGVGGVVWQTETLIQGVESFQVLYGVDGVSPNTAPVPAAALGSKPNAQTALGQPDSIPDRYLRSDELSVAGDEKATNENWRRVRSVRIGLILRSTANITVDRNLAQVNQVLYPLGPGIFSSLDRQTSFVQSPITGDGRLRQVMTFTVYLRNYQGV